MTTGAGPVRPGHAEVASLAERMAYMQALRVGFAVLVLASGLFVSDVVGASFGDLLLGTAGYVLISGLLEGLRRVEKGAGIRIVQIGLLIDGVYIAWTVYSTGGVSSPLRFLFYVHLIAVTLLASYRTGIKIAAWHSLLSFVVLYAQSSGVVEVREGVAGALPGEGPLFNRFAMFNIAALWLVALGTAVFSALNERELKRRKSDVEDLVHMAAALEDVSTPNDIAMTVLDHVCQSFGFKRGAVLTAEDDAMQLLAFRGPGESQPFRSGIDAIVSRAMDKKTPQLVKKLNPESDHNLASLLAFAKNVAVFPMTAEGQAVGVLVVEYAGATSRIERRVVDVVSQFAAHGALALRNSWLLETVQIQAETDALTGIANRRMFEETLRREMSRAARNGEQLTLAMFDIDHFKSLNDKYGHQTGDEVLQKVAAALANACRDFDTPARYGGEEFALILPSCSTRESLAVGERLRQSLAKIEDLPVKVTASAGVATFPAHAAEMEALIKAADEALYESKRTGRDRVTRSRRRARARKAAIADLLAAEDLG